MQFTKSLFIIFTMAGATFAQAQEVFVEAARIDKERIDPSRTVTVISGQELSTSKYATVADILRDVPGLQLTRQGSVGQNTSVFIRGARSEGTLVVIDGVEVNDPSSPSSGYDFSSLTFGGIERIEIYHGPQSVRFGAGAIGGVINIITKDSKASDSPVSYLLEGGSFATKHATLQASSHSTTAGFLATVDGYQTEGFSAASGGSEDDGAKIFTFTGKANWQPSKSSSITTSIRHSNARIEIDRQGGPQGDDPNNISKVEQTTAGISASDRYFGDRLKTSLGVYVVENRRSLRNEPDRDDTTDSQEDFKSRNFKAQSDSDLLLGENHTLRLGLQWREERAQQTQGIFGAGLTYLYDSETWFYDLGFREDASTTVGAIQSYHISAGRQFDKTKFTMAYGTGFKLPSLYQLYSSFGDRNLHQENAKTFDLSLEQRFSANSGFVLTYFESRYENLIDFNMSTSKYFNILKALSKGIESELRIQLSKPYRLHFNYSYLEAKDKSTGLGLLRRPYHSAGFTFSRKSENVDLYLRYRYRGARPDIDPATFQRMQNQAYDVWEIGSTVHLNERLRIFGRIENAFDRRHQEVAGYATPGLSVFAGLAGDL